ncbi:MAG: peptide deformylase [Legionella sp.]|nr:peptide deformylase [Legionella sp.]
MTIHKILYLPHDCLRKVAKSVEHFDDKLQTLIDDMFETMYAAHGVGLAAPQIGVSLQVAVVDVKGDKTEQIVLINPQIIDTQGQTTYEEGCLSIPGVYDKVTRPQKVKIKALDRTGKSFEIEGEGLLAECFEHEIDHLNGKLFIDRLSPLKRTVARRKLEKFKRQLDREQP